MGKSAPSSTQKAFATLIKEVAARDDLLNAHSHVVETLRLLLAEQDRSDREQIFRRVLEARTLQELIQLLRKVSASLVL